MFSSDDGLIIKNWGVLASDGLPIYYGTKRKHIARKKVVLTSSEDDVHIISSTQTSPENKRITRSMVKEKGTEVPKEMSPILLDDSPKRPSPEPSLFFFWDHDILQTTNYLSPTKHCQEIPP